MIKLDMDLVHDPHKPESVEAAAIVDAYTENTGALILAEGIETQEDVTTAVGLGARWDRAISLEARPNCLSRRAAHRPWCAVAGTGWGDSLCGE